MPDLPAGCLGVWNVFCELSNRRPSTGFGPGVLSHEHLLAWQQLHGTRLTPWEIDTIFMLDLIWLKSKFEEKPAPPPARP